MFTVLNVTLLGFFSCIKRFEIRASVAVYLVVCFVCVLFLFLSCANNNLLLKKQAVSRHVLSTGFSETERRLQHERDGINGEEVKCLVGKGKKVLSKAHRQHRSLRSISTEQ